MPRKGPAPRRELLPDPIYHDRVVTRFINRLFTRGKRSVGEKIFYTSMEIMAEKTGQPAIEVFHRAVKNVMPVVEVKPRRVGGATYQVPVEVPSRRARTLAVRWLVDFARARSEYSMSERLANEILDATKQQGNAYKRKDDIFRMAQANKAFAHYRW